MLLLGMLGLSDEDEVGCVFQTSTHWLDTCHNTTTVPDVLLSCAHISLLLAVFTPLFNDTRLVQFMLAFESLCI